MADQTEPVTRTADAPPIDETELRALVERPTKAEHWGAEHDITPRVIGKVFGNGQRLINISPMMTRPNYFVVRVDSAEDWDVRDVLDDIYEAGEEEFGRYDADEEEDPSVEDEREFPIVDWGAGCCWGKRYTIEDLRSAHQEESAVQP